MSLATFLVHGGAHRIVLHIFVSALSGQLRFAIIFMLRLCHWTRWRSYSTIRQHHQRVREKRAKERKTKKLVTSVRFMRHARRINLKHTALLLNVYVLASRSREKGRNIRNVKREKRFDCHRDTKKLRCVVRLLSDLYRFGRIILLHVSVSIFSLFLFTLTSCNFWFRCSLTLGTSNVEQNGSFDTNIIIFYASIGFQVCMVCVC